MSSGAVPTGLPQEGVLLASASPRRLQLLQQMGLPVAAWPAEVDEAVAAGETPRTYVSRMSQRKCAAACAAHEAWLLAPGRERVILAADTIVVAGGEIIGKPDNEAAAIAMLTTLSGNVHEVMTSVTVACGQCRQSALSVAQVRFRSLSQQEIRAYVDTGEGRDKAGSYGIQGIGGIFAEHISGSYSAVVGLPIATVEKLLTEMGIDTWRLRALTQKDD